MLENLPKNWSEKAKPLEDRLNDFYEQKNAFRKLNGEAPMGEDMQKTLQALEVLVGDENLSAKVLTSLGKYSAEGKTAEQVWLDQKAAGANMVKIVEGIFGFYRGEEKLPDNTRPMEISVLPQAYLLRQQEKLSIMSRTKDAMAELRKQLNG
ncbi:MAG: hypothetical protein ACRCZE_03610 [Candidatus Altimarinota bacterium]